MYPPGQLRFGFEPVEVTVPADQAPPDNLVDERERRALCRRAAERCDERCGERRLARAKVTDQRDRIATGNDRRERATRTRRRLDVG